MDRVLPPWTAPGGRRMPVRAPGWPRHARAAPARSTCRRERKALSMRQQPRRRGRAVRTARGARPRRPCRRWPATVGPARTAARSRGRRRRPVAAQRRDRRTVANRSGTPEKTGCRTARKIRPPDRGPTTSMRQGKTARPPGKRFVPCLTANKGRIGSDTHERHGGRARKAPPDWHVRRDGFIRPSGLRIQAQKKPGPKTGLCLLRVACGFACRTVAISAAWRWCGPARQRCSVRQRAAPCRQRRR